MKRHKCKFLGCPCWMGIDVDQLESDVQPSFDEIVRELADRGPGADGEAASRRIRAELSEMLRNEQDEKLRDEMEKQADKAWEEMLES